MDDNDKKDAANSVERTSIPLKHAITIDGAKVSQISLRRPRVSDLKLMDRVRGDVTKTAALISHLGGMAPEHVDMIDGDDYMTIAEVIANDFLGGHSPDGI